MKIAYSANPSSMGQTGMDVFVMNVKTFQVKQLTHTGNGDAPAWSPDGKQIAYQDNQRIVIVDSAGIFKRAITTSISSGYKPAWSPDGSMLAITDRDSRIMLIRISDLTLQPVNQGLNGTNPSWSPDGKRLAFIYDDLYIEDTDGANSHLLTVIGNISHPSWSPDGQSIAFAHEINSQRHDVDILDLASKTITTVTQGIQPAWSPDGKKLAFISDRSGQTEIYTINVDGTGLTQLTYNPSGGICPH